jgi:hypothetical protein
MVHTCLERDCFPDQVGGVDGEIALIEGYIVHWARSQAILQVHPFALV